MTTQMEVPNLPKMPANTQREVRQAFDALKNWFKKAQVNGLLVGSGTTQSSSGSGGGSEGSPVTPDPTIPPQVTGLVVSGGFASIMLTWDEVSMDTAFVAVYRAPEDNFGLAVMVGTTYSRNYADTPPTQSLSDTYYYWVRAISIWGIEGPLNDTNGTPGSTADSPAYVLELITKSKWQASTAVVLNQRVIPTKPNGYAYICTHAGTTGPYEPTWRTTINETFSDGSATWKCESTLSLDQIIELGIVDGVVKAVIRSILIGDAAITNAKIANLSADKLTVPGTASIWDAIITQGVITNAYIGNTIQSDNFVSGETGWQINKDGSAQFRGQVAVTSDDGNTKFGGDSIRVFDNAGTLRVKIGKL